MKTQAGGYIKTHNKSKLTFTHDLKGATHKSALVGKKIVVCTK